MRKPLLVICMVTVFLFAAASGQARGLYVGAGIGSSFYGQDVNDITGRETTESDVAGAFKIFGGWRKEKILGIEGGYRNFGTVSTRNLDLDKVETNTTGWDIEALGRIEVLIFDLFAKAGAIFWSTNAEVGGGDQKENGTAFLWGLGAGIHLGPFGIRLEWESAEVSTPDNLSMLSLSGTFGF